MIATLFSRTFHGKILFLVPLHHLLFHPPQLNTKLKTHSPPLLKHASHLTILKYYLSASWIVDRDKQERYNYNFFLHLGWELSKATSIGLLLLSWHLQKTLAALQTSPWTKNCIYSLVLFATVQHRQPTCHRHLVGQLRQPSSSPLIKSNHCLGNLE